MTRVMTTVTMGTAMIVAIVAVAIMLVTTMAIVTVEILATHSHVDYDDCFSRENNGKHDIARLSRVTSNIRHVQCPCRWHVGTFNVFAGDKVAALRMVPEARAAGDKVAACG